MSKSELNSTNAPEEQRPARIKHSRVGRNYNFFPTLRFGEIAPFFFDELVPNDRNIEIGADVNIRSLNLKSPLMQDMKLMCRYFTVPYQCILPLNWERIFSNPTIGSDVPRDANCLLSPYAFRNIYYQKSDSAVRPLTISKQFELYLTDLVINELVFSPCSLASMLGINLRNFPLIEGDVRGAFLSNSDMLNDLWRLFNPSEDVSIYLQALGAAASPYRFPYEGINDAVHFGRALLTWIQSFPSFEFGYTNPNVLSRVETFVNKWVNVNRDHYALPRYDVNVGILYAYQLVCAHFYSNDFVDFVYSSDLFRLAIQGLSHSAFNSDDDTEVFDYNGIPVQYDILSQRHIQRVLADFDFGDDSAFKSVRALIISLFRFNRSLKFEDYFSSLKTRPLAVGNTTITPASDGSIDVVDVSRSIQMQRFLNQVNRVGRKFEDYTKGIFGRGVAYDYHNPKHIGTFSISISSPETDNTGGAQLELANSTTSNFRGGTSSKRFWLDCDRFTYVIGLASFDVSRSYVDGSSPLTRRYDRFDFFNPYMQYVGDESIPLSDYDMRAAMSESINTQTTDLNDFPAFGFGVRRYAYKVRPNVALESFRKNLPSWTFIDDNSYYRHMLGSYAPHLDSNFIRCLPAELDKYFVSLTGVDFTDYFHFECAFFNRCQIDRPMVTAPQILG